MEFSVKTLKRWAVQEEVTSLEIKKRGVDIVPEQLRQQVLGGKGGKKAARRTPKVHRTLVLVRTGDQRLALVVEPL